MARKDDILQSFLTHDLFVSKYGLKKEEMPTSVMEAFNSKEPILKAIAIIIEGLEWKPQTSDNALNIQIRQFLNDNAL